LIRLILGILFFLASLANAETSMFGAGDLESPKPYGLTKTEEVIVKNKKIVIENEKRLKKTSTQLQDLLQRVGGVDSLLEGESLKLNKVSKLLNKEVDNLKVHIQTSTSDINKNSEIIANMQTSVNSNLKTLESQVKQNEKNIKTINDSFDKIVILVNKINSNYVTKKEFDNLISMLDKKEIKTVKTKTSKKSTTSTEKSSQDLMSEAKAFFKRDYFTNAKPIFKELISRHYKPAESNFYIGEIKYYRKKYKSALYFFKKSMTLYDKAEYLPKLLLHSAISFDKLGDKENANNFYSTVVEVYPESDEAKEASKKIKKN
jgi:TolA-binding protein